MPGKSINDHPIIKKMVRKDEFIWINPNCDNKISDNVTLSDIEDAAERLGRFAPYIQKMFPETAETKGIIESPLVDIPFMKEYLEERAGAKLKGRLMLKCDNDLPISGSVKARGGIYEVLWFAEKVAIESGMLKMTDDYAILAEDKFRKLFAEYSIVVGSTGNLGLSIGVMGAKLGFQVAVHMSVDASQWKKELLRDKGAEVIEHSGDYSEAVAVGRKQAQENERSHFVDDEDSRELFIGYGVTGLRMKEQLDKLGIVVDKNNPLFVYLPCGVGSAPGGVAYGLKHMYGENVYCFFAEPTNAPCVFLGVVTGLHDKISVHDIGLDGKTIADGLAVSRASKFVGGLMSNLIDGFFTVADSDMEQLVGKLYNKEQIFAEPSATSGFPGYALVQQQEEYLKRFSPEVLKNSTHILWATGGGMVPDDVRAKHLSIGQDCANKPASSLNYEVFDKEIPPTESEIRDFVGTELFTELHNYLCDSYKVKPKQTYSGCSMDNNIWRGWNIKYQKNGKSLCTIYPQQGYFLVLVPGKPFEVRSNDTVGEVKLAIEIRNDEISAKKAVAYEQKRH